MVLFILFSMFFSCTKEVKLQPITEEGFYLDTVIKISLFSFEKKADEIFKVAFDKLAKMEKIFSSYIEDSEVSNINKNAGIAPQKVSKELLFLIKESLQFSDLSAGEYDITVFPLVKLWNITGENPQVPPVEKIKEAQQKINYKKIEIEENNSTVFLKDKGMALDLGGSAKGYIQDLIIKELIDMGVKSAILDFGGNISLIGLKGEKNFMVGIKDPFSTDKIAGKISLKGPISIVTSGTYERFFLQDGKKYFHILSTKTGFPAENDLESVTIIYPQSYIADSLSTTFFLLGSKKAIELSKKFEGLNYIMILKDKSVLYSKDLEGNLELLDDFKNKK